MSEKLQKVLARAGLGSRREMEQWIADGRVRVNGKPATLGDRVSDLDRLDVDGRPLSHKRTHETPRKVLIYNKPEGEVCTRSDEEGRPTIFDKLPRVHGRWINVGRLDINTSGLILLTNDGELANKLMHPSSEIEREYAVRVLGKVDEGIVKQLTSGVELEDGEARFDSVLLSGGEGANTWFHVVLKEGRKREVRRLWEAVGLTVSRLIRVRYGPIKLPPRLRTGHSMALDEKGLNLLLDAVGLQHEKPSKPALKRGPKKPLPRKTAHGTRQSRERHRNRR